MIKKREGRNGLASDGWGERREKVKGNQGREGTGGSKKVDYEWREDGCSETREKKRREVQEKKRLGMEGACGGEMRWGRGQGGD